MNTRDVGKIGELVAMKELSKLGYDIFLPTSDHLPFDFIIHKEGELLKVQVKTRTKTKGVLSFKLTRNSYKRYDSLACGRDYNERDFDWLIVVDIDSESIYKFIWDDIRDSKFITLRVDECKNNQVANVWQASKYALVVKGISHESSKL